MANPKRVLEFNQPIDTTKSDDGHWVARLPALDIEESGDTHDAAQDAAFQAMMAKLDEMSDDDARAWIEANSTPMPEGYVPECFVGTPDAAPIAEVL